MSNGVAVTPILKVNTKSVPPIPENQLEEFKRKYTSNTYIHDGEAGFDDRLKNAIEIQYKRWDWMQAHPDIYVNMLRVSGHKDENIQACVDGKRPLCFLNADLYREFTLDLNDLKQSIERETEFKNVRFVQAGSSVAGFSNNPLKGLRDIPSKITDAGKSDVDVVIVAKGVKEFIDRQKNNNIPLREYPSTTSRKGAQEIRFGLKHWEAIPSIKDWIEKWKVIMGGGVQITLQEADPVLPPWEPYIVLPK